MTELFIDFLKSFRTNNIYHKPFDEECEVVGVSLVDCVIVVVVSMPLIDSPFVVSSYLPEIKRK